MRLSSLVNLQLSATVVMALLPTVAYNISDEAVPGHSCNMHKGGIRAVVGLVAYGVRYTSKKRKVRGNCKLFTAFRTFSPK